MRFYETSRHLHEEQQGAEQKEPFLHKAAKSRRLSAQRRRTLLHAATSIR